MMLGKKVITDSKFSLKVTQLNLLYMEILTFRVHQLLIVVIDSSS